MEGKVVGITRRERSYEKILQSQFGHRHPGCSCGRSPETAPVDLAPESAERAQPRPSCASPGAPSVSHVTPNQSEYETLKRYNDVI